jgi:hypothetical protein
MDKGTSIFGIIIVILIGVFLALSKETLMFILLYILLPIVGLIIVIGLVIALIKGLKNKNIKPEKK